MNIADVLRLHAAKRGHHLAVDDEGVKVTYRELSARVDMAAAYLRDAGIGPGDFVALMLPSSRDHIVVLYALAQLGAVSLSVDLDLPLKEREKAFAGLDVKATITETGAAPMPAHRGLALGAVCASREVCSTSAPTAEAPFDEDQPLMLVQSSGTTGAPKRLLITHAQMAMRNIRHIKAMGLTSGDRYKQSPDLTWMSGRRRCMTILHVGGTVVISDSPTPTDELVTFGEKHITYYFLTPLILSQFLSSLPEIDSRSGGPPYPDLKLAVASAPIRQSQWLLARQKLAPQFRETYATNEVGDLTVALPADHDRYPNSVGRLIDDVEAVVVDDMGQSLPLGKVGLIGFRAPAFPTTYYDNEEVSRKGFRDGWFYPGDLASINDERYVFLKGRADDVINCGGGKFYAIEVEDVLMSHPAVSDVAVVGRQYGDDLQVAVAFFSIVADVTVEDLVTHCKSRLATHKVPFHFERVAQIPRNVQGKALKRNLKIDFQRKYKFTREEAGWVADAGVISGRP